MALYYASFGCVKETMYVPMIAKARSCARVLEAKTTSQFNGGLR